MKQKLEQFFSGKSILILGFGREGRTWLDILNSLNFDEKPVIAIASKSIENPPQNSDIKLFIGDNYLDACEHFDVILQSPGVIIKNYISDENKAKITSQTDLLLRFCTNKIIGVTGTKGKSTTSCLIHHFLKANGKKSILVGNIGVPPLEAVLDIQSDVNIVCEMSCHQLEFVRSSPNVAVLLNVFEEHLDHYIDFNAYKNAKENIFRFQGINDIFIYNHKCETDEIANVCCMNKLIASINSPSDICVHEGIRQLDVLGYRYSFDEIPTPLIGLHNMYNVGIALAVSYYVGCEMRKSIESLANFIPLEHRLEVFGKVGGAEFVNDSISTTPYATIMAVKAFDRVDTLILGGTERHISYDVLTAFLEEGSVENLIFLPNTGKRIANSLTNSNLKLYFAKDMQEAVKIAKEVTKIRCILSPAAASYGFYLNFEERGEHFKRLVLGCD